MPRGALIGILVVLAAVGVGMVVADVEFVGNTSPVDSGKTVNAPEKHWLKQQYQAQQSATQRSATETIQQDCAAVRKLGASNPNCPPQ